MLHVLITLHFLLGGTQPVDRCRPRKLTSPYVGWFTVRLPFLPFLSKERKQKWQVTAFFLLGWHESKLDCALKKTFSNISINRICFFLLSRIREEM